MRVIFTNRQHRRADIAPSSARCAAAAALQGKNKVQHGNTMPDPYDISGG